MYRHDSSYIFVKFNKCSIGGFDCTRQAIKDWRDELDRFRQN